MPIEIREFNIRVHVNQNSAQASEGSTSATQQAPAGKDEVIAECVEQIMEILNNKKER